MKNEGENKKSNTKKNGGGGARNRALWDIMRCGSPKRRKKGAERIIEEITKTKVDKKNHSFIHLRGSTKSK